MVAASTLFPQIDQWQDLGSLSLAINRDANGHALALLLPDETTIAIFDHQLRTPFAELNGPQQDGPQLAAQWFSQHPANGLILIDLLGHAIGKFTRLLNKFGHPKKLDDDMLLTLEQDNIARVVARYDLPHGRRYALVESAQSPVLARTDGHGRTDCAQQVCT